MVRMFMIICSLCFSYISFAWSPQGNKIKTRWAEQVTVENVWQIYPRPQLKRVNWKNLNGLWKYQVTEMNRKKKDVHYGDEILVPFSIESSLSGVEGQFGPSDKLWYRKEFTIDPDWKGKQILLHFGAVDYECQVWVNNILVGKHTGGNNPFSFNITRFLKKDGKQVVELSVTDPTDTESITRGKQQLNQRGIWYTPVTGIWQTVWLEPVTARHIEELRITPDIDQHLLTVKAHLNMRAPSDLIEVNVYDGNQLVATGKSINDEAVVIPMPEDAKLWSPDFPFLYTLKVMLKSDNKILDQVNSYAAMRKYSTKRDANGIVRLELNNQPLFQFGPLDQGWWPDGLYTAPTDEALVYDIQKTKDLGFNMIRKHIKVEPARWYTHCDQLGIIVWQDMPSGDRNPEWQNRKYFEGTEKKRSAVSEACYRKEWKEIIDCLYSYPCIGTWVPFNEAWGQFKTLEIAEWTKQYDPSRLVNPASGGNHYTCGDMLDLHNYPGPEMYLYDAQRATVLGEYGGIGLVLKEHLWEPNRNWGYVQFSTSKEATDEYLKYANMLKDMIARGFSAAVYTQTTDVEIEVNGLMTYDRKVIKLDEQKLKRANTEICESLK